MTRKLLLTLDEAMYQWLLEKQSLLKFRTIQQVIEMLIGVAIERQQEASYYGEE